MVLNLIYWRECRAFLGEPFGLPVAHQRNIITEQMNINNAPAQLQHVSYQTHPCSVCIHAQPLWAAVVTVDS